MPLNAAKLGLATAIVLAIFWPLMGVVVMSATFGQMPMGGHMGGYPYDRMHWTMNWAGFLYGLVFSSIVAGLAVWAIAALYNRLIKAPQRED